MDVLPCRGPYPYETRVRVLLIFTKVRSSTIDTLYPGPVLGFILSRRRCQQDFSGRNLGHPWEVSSCFLLSVFLSPGIFGFNPTYFQDPRHIPLPPTDWILHLSEFSSFILFVGSKLLS